MKRLECYSKKKKKKKKKRKKKKKKKKKKKGRKISGTSTFDVFAASRQL